MRTVSSSHSPNSTVDPPHRAVILSGVRLYCEGLSERLARNDQLRIVGIATTLADAQELFRELRPNVLLIDASAREFLRAVSSLRQLSTAVVVAFAVGDEEGEAIACAEAGVNAFVERGASVDDLVRAVVGCARGELSLSPRLVAALFRRVAYLARVATVTPVADLTVREAEIYSLLRQGLSNKEIAARLRLRISTVKNHVHRLLEKLGVHRRTEAAALSRRVAAPSAGQLAGWISGTSPAAIATHRNAEGRSGSSSGS